MVENVHILILETNPADIELIERELAGKGISFVSRAVHTEKEYLKALLEFSPDIILAAYDLPQFSGLEALQLARNCSPELPFILVTGAIGEEKTTEILTGGATDYVMKHRLTRLAPAVRRALNEAEALKRRKAAEAERDMLLRELEDRVRQRTAELESEIAERRLVQQHIDAHMSNTPLAVIEFDPSFRVIFWSPEAERLFGWSAAEMNGKVLSEINWVYEDDMARVRQILADMLSTVRPRNMHANRNYRKDGSIVNCEWYNSAIYDEDGRLASILSFVLDVTERDQFQRALREGEERLQRASRAGRTGLYEINLIRQTVFWSREAYKLYGQEMNSPVDYSKWINSVHPEDRDRAVRNLEDMLARARTKPDALSYKNEFRVLRKDGTVLWVESAGTFELENGELILRGAIRDVTERKHTEQALRESEESVKALLNAATHTIFLMNTSGIIMAHNAAFYENVGLSPSQKIIGRCAYDLLPPDLSAERRKRVQEVVRTGRVLCFEDRREGKLLTNTLYPIFNTAGEVGRLAVFSMDITEQRKAQEALRESTERFRSAFDMGAVPMALTTSEGRLMLVNPAFCMLLGYSEAELAEMSIYEINHPDDNEAIRNGILPILSGQKDSFRMEKRYIRKDGQIVWVDMSTASVRDANSRPMYFVTHCQDITERKRAEQALQSANEELDRRVKQRTAQLSDMNESLLAEIRERKRTENQLRSAQMNLRAMSTEVVLAEERSRQQFATNLHDTVVQTLGAAKLRSELIQDQIPEEARGLFAELQEMLSDSVKQARTIMAEMSPPVLNELGLVSALEWLTEQVEEQHGIAVRFRIDNNEGPVSFPREIEVLLFQATRELLINVVKHSKAQSATVKFSNTGRNLMIEVSDNGIGLDRNKTFVPDLKGGFGLYSIRERLRHIGGKLAIKSKTGQGTTVLVTASNRMPP